MELHTRRENAAFAFSFQGKVVQKGPRVQLPDGNSILKAVIQGRAPSCLFVDVNTHISQSMVFLTSCQVEIFYYLFPVPHTAASPALWHEQNLKELLLLRHGRRAL